MTALAVAPARYGATDRLAVVLAEAVDRRTQLAVEYAVALRVHDVWALHLAFDASDAADFAAAWARSPFASIPVAIVDVGDGDVGDVARAALAELWPGELLVLVPVLALPRTISRLLHRSWAARVADAVRPLEHVAIGTVPVPVRPF